MINQDGFYDPDYTDNQLHYLNYGELQALRDTLDSLMFGLTNWRSIGKAISLRDNCEDLMGSYLYAF